VLFIYLTLFIKNELCCKDRLFIRKDKFLDRDFDLKKQNEIVGGFEFVCTVKFLWNMYDIVKKVYN